MARAIVLVPQVLLLDEALSNLDTKVRRRVREELRDLQQHLGITAVYVAHDQEEALAVSDQIIVMNQASIAQVGILRDLYEQPASRFVADFIGDANLVQGEIAKVVEGRAEVRLGEATLDLPARGLQPGAATVAIRPHAIRVNDAPVPGGSPLEVRHAVYLGSDLKYELAGALEHLFATVLVADRLIGPGTTAFVTFNPKSLSLIPD